MTNHSLPLLALIAISLSGAHAWSATPTAAQWEIAAAARQQRADLLRDEIGIMDTRIEGRIDTIVGALRSIGDSKDSRTKVSQMKEQTIKALGENIKYFQSKRARLLEELRRPTLQLTEEQKRKGIELFDVRIEKRIAQILAVQKSLPVHEDYERYKVTGSNWNGTTYAVNEDHRQNQRVTAYTDAQRKLIVENLRKSITRIEGQTRTLKARGAGSDEIAKNDALLAERRGQLATALSPVATPTRAIGLNEAIDLDKALQIALGELHKDFGTLFARYWAYLEELSSANAARNDAQAAKAKS